MKVKIYRLYFSPQTPDDERGEILGRLEEMGCRCSPRFENSPSDAALGKLPTLAYILIHWDFDENFYYSEIYSDLPNGCTVHEMN